jgi:general secretion pathway protein D
MGLHPQIRPNWRTSNNVLGAALLLAAFPGVILAQATNVGSAQPSQSESAQQSATQTGDEARQPRNSDRRHAAKLYLAASKLFMDEHFQEAMKDYDEAARLDPGNRNYPLAADVARSHAVTALIQTAAKARLKGDAEGARAALAHALELDPKSVEASQHLFELGDDAIQRQPTAPYGQSAESIGEAIRLEPAAGLHSFHLRNNQRQIVEQVFKAYGIDAMMDESVHATACRLDIDDAGFEDAVRAVSMVTHTFNVPLDAHRVVVASDTTSNRQQFTRQEMETVYLSGLKADELTEVSNLAKQIFNVQQAVTEASAKTITIRAPRYTVEAFNNTIRQLIDGHNQVLLDVRLIQIAHTNQRNLGIQPPQSFTAFNVYAEEQSILNHNQALVQQIISSGLAAPGDTLAILGILLASGQVSSSIFSNGIALFGGGIGLSGLSPGPAKAFFNLNSSDTRELDNIQLRLGDGEVGSVKSGERYPIQTSSFSSLSASVPNIPGLNSAGASGSLSSILASLQGSVPNIPQVQYQDLGLTLKTTANVMRSNDVALTLDLQLTALSGSSIDGNPILNSRSYSGVVTIKEGSAVVVASELDKSESRDISGTPGFSEIPGMNNVTDKDIQKNYATLLVIITPHVVRGTQASGHSPMMRVERAGPAQ